MQRLRRISKISRNGTKTSTQVKSAKQALNGDTAQLTNRDAQTDAMLAAERAVWEAWRTHDAKKLADLTARDISFINIFGVYLPTTGDLLRCQDHQHHQGREHHPLAHS